MLEVENGKISSVHKSLLQDDSGYKIIIKRLIENRKNRLKRLKKAKRGSLSPMSRIKKKYPLHFLLNNLLDTAIEKISENEKELEKEALLYTPSSTFLRKNKKTVNYYSTPTRWCVGVR